MELSCQVLPLVHTSSVSTHAADRLKLRYATNQYIE